MQAITDSSPSPAPTAIVQRLADIHSGIQRDVANAALGYYRAGELLNIQQGKLGKGDFDLWLEANRTLLGFGRSTAYVYKDFQIQHAGRTAAEIEGLTLKTPRVSALGSNGSGAFSIGLVGQFSRGASVH
jgi:hypothetical protein